MFNMERISSRISSTYGEMKSVALAHKLEEEGGEQKPVEIAQNIIPTPLSYREAVSPPPRRKGTTPTAPAAVASGKNAGKGLPPGSFADGKNAGKGLPPRPSVPKGENASEPTASKTEVVSGSEEEHSTAEELAARRQKFTWTLSSTSMAPTVQGSS